MEWSVFSCLMAWPKMSCSENGINDQFPTLISLPMATPDWKKSIDCARRVVRSIAVKFRRNGKQLCQNFSGHHSTSMENFHLLCWMPSHADALSTTETKIFCWPFLAGWITLSYLTYKRLWWFNFFANLCHFVHLFGLLGHFVDLFGLGVPICTQKAANF